MAYSGIRAEFGDAAWLSFGELGLKAALVIGVGRPAAGCGASILIGAAVEGVIDEMVGVLEMMRGGSGRGSLAPID